MEDTFKNIYEKCVWGNNCSTTYKGSSGPGSSVEYNINTYVPFIKKFINNNKIKSIIDLGCGDFRCGSLIYNDLDDIVYYGYDTYNNVIENNKKNHSPPKYNFEHLDFCNKKEEIKSGDLCILKDVLQHWGIKEIYTFLDYLVETKKYKYILICNCCHQTQNDVDIQNGEYRPLSSDYYPLKKYNPKKLFYYHSKELSVIQVY